MRLGMIGFCFSVICTSFLPGLPEHQYLILLVVASAILLILKRMLFFAGLILGLFWASAYGWLSLAQQLPISWDGQDIWVEGRISGLPKDHGYYRRFDFNAARFMDAAGEPLSLSVKRIRLSHYGKQTIHPGENWRFLVRLKSPRGFANPGGFDYEAHLLRANIGATGYVRRNDGNHRLQPAGLGARVDRIREHMSNRLDIALTDLRFAGTLRALVLGDKSGLDKEAWGVYSRTGTNHLMVISGLHIGFVALCVYWLTLQLGRVISLGINIGRPLQQLCAVAALIAAFGYALLAGFSLPTQRALIMLAVLLSAQLLCRQVDPWQRFLIALTAVLLWDPLAPVSAGFWLSFGAVAALLYAYIGHRAAGALWRRMLWPQLVIAVALFPFLILLFNQASLIAPIANLVAIPLMGFVVVPLTLFASLLALFSDTLGVGVGLFSWADAFMGYCWFYLDYLAKLPWSALILPTPSPWVVGISCAGLVYLLLPLAPRYKLLSAICLLPMILYRPPGFEEGQFQMTVLDVGQGEAVVIQTRNHLVLYDTGPKYGARFDAGAAVVMPYLKSKGVSHIDRIVVSHGDSDHRGGLQSIMAAVSFDDLFVGADLNDIGQQSKPCATGGAWTWDGVSFELFTPGADLPNRNDKSCVLRVSNTATAVLIPGDIESSGESALLAANKMLAADVLVAPHHGSRTSSGADFIKAVSPHYVVFSAGYRNRFGHPHEDVLERYQSLGAEMINTSSAGAVTFVMGADEDGREMAVYKYRESRRRYWFSQDAQLY